MKKGLKRLLGIIGRIGIVFLCLIVLLFLVRLIGKLYYGRTPDGGIRETMYLDVSGQAQWISIYGEDKDNPVMLFLHGGPGESSGATDWVILRKLAKDYTVVSWDQPGCGKTQIRDPQKAPVTPAFMRDAIDAVVNGVLDETGKDRITILGHSWGTMYGGDYVLRHPEKADCLIDLSLSLDRDAVSMMQKGVEDYIAGETDYQTAIDRYGCRAFLFYDFTDRSSCLHSREDYRKYFEAIKQMLTDWTESSEEDRALADQFDPEQCTNLMCSSSETDAKKAMHVFGQSVLPLTDKYVYSSDESLFDGDVNPLFAAFFNPYYSIADYVKIAFADDDSYFQPVDPTDENSRDACDVLLDEFDLGGKTEYAVPVYVLQGRDDNYCGVIQSYFDRIHAPDKELRYLDGGHMSTLIQSEQLAQFVHEIAGKRKNS